MSDPKDEITAIKDALYEWALKMDVPWMWTPQGVFCLFCRSQHAVFWTGGFQPHCPDHCIASRIAAVKGEPKGGAA